MLFSFSRFLDPRLINILIISRPAHDEHHCCRTTVMIKGSLPIEYRNPPKTKILFLRTHCGRGEKMGAPILIGSLACSARPASSIIKSSLYFLYLIFCTFLISFYPFCLYFSTAENLFHSTFHINL